MQKYEILESPKDVFTVTIYDGTKPGEPMGGLHAVATVKHPTLKDAQAWVKDHYPDAGQLMKGN